MNRRPPALVPAAALLAAFALCAAGPASAPLLPLPAPPPANNQAAGTLFDAMMAISRTTASNPSAAQAAAFSYNAAIRQYDAGDRSAAQSTALHALFQTAQPPLPTSQSAFGAPAIPSPALVSLPPSSGIAQATAEDFLALGRRTLQRCGAAGSATLPQAQADYAAAVRAHLAHDYPLVQRESLAVINICAVAEQQLTQQQNQQTAPQTGATAAIPVNPTPYPTGVIPTPQPAPPLQAAPVPEALFSPLSTPAPRRKFLGLF